MATTVQARLDAETAAILKRVARERGWSSSQAVREGIHLLAPQSDAVKSVQIHGLGMFDAGVTDLATNQVKRAVGRLRPENAVGGTFHQQSGQWQRLPADLAPDRERGTSFPSAHAANSAALALLAMCFWPGLRRGVWALPLLVGWSRVYLGKHYPSDVLGGWLLGLCVGWLCWLLWRAAARRWCLQLRAEPAEE